MPFAFIPCVACAPGNPVAETPAPPRTPPAPPPLSRFATALPVSFSSFVTLCFFFRGASKSPPAIAARFAKSKSASATSCSFSPSVVFGLGFCFGFGFDEGGGLRVSPLDEGSGRFNTVLAFLGTAGTRSLMVSRCDAHPPPQTPHDALPFSFAFKAPRGSPIGAAFDLSFIRLLAPHTSQVVLQNPDASRFTSNPPRLRGAPCSGPTRLQVSHGGRADCEATKMETNVCSVPRRSSPCTVPLASRLTQMHRA
mmetsp:Transcript_11150/g.41326  ORF Transcript_11150/g.41326 Transcript_11150/m.41326 type:complete len:253 (-) Transcript_11150:68-826(-)